MEDELYHMVEIARTEHKFDIKKFKEIGEKISELKITKFDKYKQLYKYYEEVESLTEQIDELGAVREEYWNAGAKYLNPNQKIALNKNFSKSQKIKGKDKNEEQYIKWLQTGLETMRLQIELKNILNEITKISPIKQ